MKNLILLIFISFFLVSCEEEFIELQPISEMNVENFYKTEEDMNQAVMSAYASLHPLHNGSYITLSEIRSDNTTYSWVPGNSANQLAIDNFVAPLLPDNSYVLDVWNDSYNTILRSNVVIDRIDEIAFSDENEKEQFKAETRFIRAYTYFWLVQLFGGVPKVEHELTLAEAYELGRAPIQEIYDLIVEDLKFAEANLPSNYAPINIGRVTKGGATGLLAKVYMTMAGYPLEKGDPYYALAEEKALEVINLGQHSLVPDYAALFSVENENTSESLFEIQYEKGGTDTGSPWNNDFAPRFSDTEVVLIGNKGGSNAPTEDMSMAYEVGDPRKEISMSDGYISDADGEWVDVPFVTKYYDVAFSNDDNSNNWPALRLADIYLIYAEALVRQNKQLDVALEYLNKIRERARNSSGGDSDVPADYSGFSSNSEFLLAILKERRVELAFENKRWFDLVRTGTAQEFMSEQQAQQYGFNPSSWDDTMLLYPIPLEVIQSNPDVITQNPGY